MIPEQWSSREETVINQEADGASSLWENYFSDDFYIGIMESIIRGKVMFLVGLESKCLKTFRGNCK